MCAITSAAILKYQPAYNRSPDLVHVHSNKMFVCLCTCSLLFPQGWPRWTRRQQSLHTFIVQFGCPTTSDTAPGTVCSGCHLLGCSTTSDTAHGAVQAATSPDLQWLPCICIYVHPITVSALQPTLHLASQPSKPTSQLPAFHPTDPPASFQPFIQQIHQLASSHSSIRSTSQLPAIHPSDPPASFQPFIQQIHQLPAIHPSDPPVSFQPSNQQVN